MRYYAFVTTKRTGLPTQAFATVTELNLVPGRTSPEAVKRLIDRHGDSVMNVWTCGELSQAQLTEQLLVPPMDQGPMNLIAALDFIEADYGETMTKAELKGFHAARNRLFDRFLNPIDLPPVENQAKTPENPTPDGPYPTQGPQL